MPDMVARADLSVAAEYAAFIEGQALPGSGVTAEAYWQGLSKLAHVFGPKRRALLARRAELQGQLDVWNKAQSGPPIDLEAYKAFLSEIGYLVPEADDFEIETADVDPEIANVPGPQLVVPVMNARYALNAANARWGSLYDALYGTDALGDAPLKGGYDPERGGRVIAWAKAFLDGAAPLAGGSWADVTQIKYQSGTIVVAGADGETGLADPSQFVGYDTADHGLSKVVLVNNGLHIEVQIDPQSQIGQSDPAHISDVVIESALTAIMDCEDSVAAVDAADKVLTYSNWLGLMKGDLSEPVTKGGKMARAPRSKAVRFCGCAMWGF